MTVDFRARLICSLGTVIDGTISRNHINDGSGLQMVGGTIVLDGLRVPPRGATVELAYEVPQDGTVTRFPHPLRVLKAQAQPQAHQTTVEVGCLLKLMSDKVDPSAAFLATFGTAAHTWQEVRQGLLDQSQAFYQDSATGLIVDAAGLEFLDRPQKRPILAQEVLEHCLKQVAIKLDPSSVPLTFPFLRWKIDLSGGFVKVIGDLLRSECCFGYVNQSERLVVAKVPTRATMGAGVMIHRSKLAELQPITGGEEPAERYRVRYQSNELPLWIGADGSRPISQWMVGRAMAELTSEGPFTVLGRALALVVPGIFDDGTAERVIGKALARLVPTDSSWVPTTPESVSSPAASPWEVDMGTAYAVGKPLAGITEDHDPNWDTVAYLLQFPEESDGGPWTRDPAPGITGTNLPPYSGAFKVFPVSSGNGTSPTARAWAYATRAAGAGVGGGDAAQFAVDLNNSKRHVPQIEINTASTIGKGQDFTAEGWVLVQVPGVSDSIVRLWSVDCYGTENINDMSFDNYRSFQDRNHAICWSGGELYWKPGAADLSEKIPEPYNSSLIYNSYQNVEHRDNARLARVPGVAANQLFHWCVQRSNGLIRLAANGRWSASFVRDERAFAVSGYTSNHYVGSGILRYSTTDAFNDNGAYARPRAQLVGKAAEIRLAIGVSRYDTTRPFVRPAGPFVASGS